MTIYLPGRTGTDTPTIEDFPSTQSEALGASVADAWRGNPTVAALDANNLYEANTGKSLLGPSLEVLTSGFEPAALAKGLTDVYRTVTAPDTVPKLDKSAAEETAKQAGVSLKIPDEGMSQAALNMLIQRQQDNRKIQDTLARAPGGLVNVGTRFLAQLATSVADPLNVASAFVPVIGEARYAQLIARAGSAFERGVVRAGVGAAEGVAGAALLEPTVYTARNQLQDDYTMANSLENIAFGAALGGGLHVVGGALRSRRPEATPAITTGAEPLSTAVEKPAISDEAFALSRKIDNGALSVEQFSQLYKENPDLAKEVIAYRAGDVAKLEPAPFEKLSPESARAQAIQELTPEFKAELLGEAGNTADKGVIADLKSQQARITEELQRIQNEPEAVFKETAKDFQGQGLSRKQAESQARQQITDREAELTAQNDALRQKIEANAASEQANQAIRDLDKGKVLDRFDQRVNAKAEEILGKRLLQESTAIPPEAAARFAVANASPEIRRSALSTAVSQMTKGRLPDVESIINMDPKDPNAMAKVTEASRRSTTPESLSVGNFDAARAAQEKLRTSPKTFDVVSAEAEMTKAVDRLNAVRENLDQAGLPTADIDAALKPFDDALITADEYGKAVRAAALCGLRS